MLHNVNVWSDWSCLFILNEHMHKLRKSSGSTSIDGSNKFFTVSVMHMLKCVTQLLAINRCLVKKFTFHLTMASYCTGRLRA